MNPETTNDIDMCETQERERVVEFGPHNRSRNLEDEEQVWEYNCWDNVTWDAEMEAEAEIKVEFQRQNSLIYQKRQGNLERVKELEAAEDELRKNKKWLRLNPQAEDLNQAASKWDVFYGNHERWFFKDRQWLRGEFKELFYDTEVTVTGEDGITKIKMPAARRIMEIGCGAGNTVFPIWKERKDDPSLEHIYACDFSDKAVELVKSFRDFNGDKMTAFVHDLASEADFPIAEGSLDAITAIFVFSALNPVDLGGAFAKIFKALRPGGLVLFRDYGRFDLTQLRLKPDRLIDQDFYFRGDGTTVHFFTPEKLKTLAGEVGFTVIEVKNDRRIITNRQRKIKMYRNWIQAKFMKPLL